MKLSVIAGWAVALCTVAAASVTFTARAVAAAIFEAFPYAEPIPRDVVEVSTPAELDQARTRSFVGRRVERVTSRRGPWAEASGGLLAAA